LLFIANATGSNVLVNASYSSLRWYKWA